MRLLVLGGTAWLGREIAAAAMRTGHDVVCLARGDSGAPAPGAQLVRADRDVDGAYDALGDSRWDVVVDVARHPGQVRRAVDALARRTEHFVFVSSGNVYADHSRRGADESAALLPPLDHDVMSSMDVYGEAKVACEQFVLHAFGAQRSTIARAGLIGGPGDVSDRSGYWPWRFARPAAADGAVLVPDAPHATVQLVDVRDLAAWLVQVGVQRTPGVFNATGETAALLDHLATARSVAAHDGPVVAAPAEWLRAHNVRPWMGERSLPLWLDDRDWVGFTARDSSRARAAGLTHRSVEAMLADTLEWELHRPRTGGRRAGLSDDDERALLAQLRT